MSSHAQSLRSFAWKLALLLALRRAARWAVFWFFLWGVAVLACRISGVLTGGWLWAGALALLPLAVLAALFERRQAAGVSQLRAAYDGLNRCGGLVMAEEAADVSAWRPTLPPPACPRLRWRGARTAALLGVSAAFALVSLWLPARFTVLAAPQPLAIGKTVGELHTEIQTLKQEKILPPQQAAELQKQLARLQKQSSALDPSKTWEALDHLKEANSDLARQAAEEALEKTTRLTEAQTLAGALDKAMAAGLDRDTATKAARDLAAMLKTAKLDDGLLKSQIPPELMAQLNGLSRDELKRLLEAIQSGKNNLGNTLTNLANLRLVDARLLAKCRNAGQCRNPNALAAFLCQCTNGCNSFSQLAVSYCHNWGRRGGPGAPMTWKDESSDLGAKFKPHALAPSGRLSDAQLLGISRTAPKLSAPDLAVQHGALAGAQAGGGAAYSQAILPEQRQAVRNFFKRDQ